MRLGPLRLGALLPLLLCAASGRAAAEPPAWEAVLELQREDGRASEAFEPGEGVVLVVALRNPTQAPIQLSLATAQTHDFRIAAADGREVWRWSDGRRFAQMLTELVLAPGEERRFQETWRPDPAPEPGRYRAEAWIGARRGGSPAAALDFRVLE